MSEIALVSVSWELLPTRGLLNCLCPKLFQLLQAIYHLATSDLAIGIHLHNALLHARDFAVESAKELSIKVNTTS